MRWLISGHLVFEERDRYGKQVLEFWREEVYDIL